MSCRNTLNHAKENTAFSGVGVTAIAQAGLLLEVRLVAWRSSHPLRLYSSRTIAHL
jgi:hypothetical protein